MYRVRTLLPRKQYSARVFIIFLGKLIFGSVLYLTLLATIFLPTYFLLPSQVKSLVYNSSKRVASLFKSFSELNLQHGVTCSQNRKTCIKSILLTGELSPGDEDSFHQYFTALKIKHPDTKTICFNSPGGYTSAAAAIAKEIKYSGFATCVGDWSVADEQSNAPLPRFTSKCESACAMLVLSGLRRIAVGDRFVVGFHSARTVIESGDSEKESSYPGSQASINNEQWGEYLSPLALEDLITSYGDSLSISQKEMKRILLEMSYTPHSKMYFPSIDELKRLQFFNEVLNP